MTAIGKKFFLLLLTSLHDRVRISDDKFWEKGPFWSNIGTVREVLHFKDLSWNRLRFEGHGDRNSIDMFSQYQATVMQNYFEPV